MDLKRTLNLMRDNVLLRFVLTVLVNLFILILYDLLTYKYLWQYNHPPLASFFSKYQSGEIHFLNLSHLAEVLIVVSLLILLTVPTTSSSPSAYIKSLFPSIFLILVFIAYDIEINTHLRIPTVRTLKILLTFKDFLGIKAIAGGLLIIGIIAIAIYFVLASFYKAIKGFFFSHDSLTKREFFTILALKVLAIAGIVYFPSLLKEHYQNIWWYEKEEVWTNGRLIASYTNSLREIKATQDLEKFEYTLSEPPHRVLFPDTLQHRPNIYFILLESFLDLSRMKDVTTSPYPIHPRLLKFLPDSTFSLTKSPVIGGFTSQATFEMITGTPGLREFAPVEFLVFGNHPTYSLLRRFKEQGYSTWAFTATSKIYYNTPTAYKNLGFDSAIFLGALTTFQEKYENSYIPDEAVYSYFIKNFDIIPKPHFVYIVTMYGHWPWYMPTDSDTISVSPRKDPLPALANVMFRKQKLLSWLIDTILKMDSNALIVAFSDHNPPFIFTHEPKWKYDAPSTYHVPILVIYKGKSISLPVVDMHRVPELIYHLIANDTLPDTSNLVPIDTKKYLYKQIIKQSRQDV
ncbi:MAG: LTA synthase family protein [Chlorobi bacterium]|nr:LTA synthase family protein [Chlorobiota bacterium]